MVKSPYNCVIYKLTQPHVANQQKKEKKKTTPEGPHEDIHVMNICENYITKLVNRWAGGWMHRRF